MQSKLNKMSELFNKFCKTKFVVSHAHIIMEYEWSEPEAEESFKGFMDMAQAELQPEPKSEG